MLPIEAIERDPGQPRVNFDPVKLQELTDGIKNSGFRKHKRIAVRRNGNGDDGNAEKFLIVNGERRWRAALKAGVREIPVDILDFANTPEGARDCFVEQFVDNYVRDGFDTIEAIEAMCKAVAEMGTSVEWLAKVTGKSVAVIKADLPLAGLPPVVKRAVDAGTCPKEVARELATFPDNKVLTAYKWAMKNPRTAKTMLAGVSAYQREIGQGTLDFNLIAKDGKDTGDLRTAKDLWERFSKQFGKFLKFADTQHATIVVAKNREVNEIEATATAMKKVAEKILHDCMAYRAQKGVPKAA